MHPTAGQLSGRNSAGSSRFAKSVAYTIATSDGRPDPAQSVRHARARPSVRLLRRPTLSSTAFRRGSGWAPSGWLPRLRSVPTLSWRSCSSRGMGRCQPSRGRFWRRTRTEPALRLGSALWLFWDTHGYVREGREWLDELLARARELPVSAVTPVSQRALAKVLDGAARMRALRARPARGDAGRGRSAAPSPRPGEIDASASAPRTGPGHQ